MMAGESQPQLYDCPLDSLFEDQITTISPFTGQMHCPESTRTYAIIELAQEPVVQHAKGEDTMSTPEERLNIFESSFNRFQNETVQAYKTMAHETTLVKGIALDNNAKLTTLTERVGVVDRRLERIDLRLDGMDAHLDYMDKRINGIDKRLNGMSEHLERIDLRFDGIDTHLNQLQVTQQEQAILLTEHTARLARIEVTQQEQAMLLTEHTAQLTDHTARLNRIETVQIEHTARLDRIENMLGQILERLPAKS